MKPRRMLGLLLTLLVVAAAMLPKAAVATADAVGGANGDNITWELSDDGVLTISGSGPMADYSARIQPWWNDRERIREVKIADGVTSVGSMAFNNCTNLKSMTIPNSVKSIGTAAFAFCGNLSNADFGSVESIEHSAFFRCNLASVTIPDSVTKIGSEVFASCDSLEHVFVDNSEAKVETGDDWNGLATVHWRHTVTAVASPDAGGTVSISPTSDGGAYWDIDPATLQPTTITVTATPEPGYFLEKLTYKAKDSAGETDITETKAFDMPNADVTVTATFKHKPKPKLIITAKNQSSTYNGSEQGESDTIVEGNDIDRFVKVEGLQPGDRINSIQIFYQRKDAGTTSIVVLNCVVDNRDNYDNDITYVPGTFTINRKSVTVTTGSASKKYDGKALTNTEARIEGLVDGETATVTATGSRINVGSSINTYSIKWGANTDENNYDVHERLGMLTIEAVSKKATLTFDLAGGTMDGKTGKVTVKATVGDTITIPGPPTREGYTFRYWRGSRYNPGDSYAVAGDHSFTAVWKKASAPGSHTVTFDANGHGTAPAAQTVKEGKAATKPADPTAEGWTFGGWFLDSSCTKTYDFSKSVTADITLYAKWTKRSATTTSTNATTTTSTLPQTGDPAAAVAALPALGASLALAGVALRRRRS